MVVFFTIIRPAAEYAAGFAVWSGFVDSSVIVLVSRYILLKFSEPVFFIIRLFVAPSAPGFTDAHVIYVGLTTIAPTEPIVISTVTVSCVVAANVFGTNITAIQNIPNKILIDLPLILSPSPIMMSYYS